MRHQSGHHDVKGSEGILFELSEFYGVEWVMYSRGVDPTGVYHALKLVAVGKCPSKANYWLAWHIQQRRIIDNKCCLIMRAHRPKLFAQVMAYLEMLA